MENQFYLISTCFETKAERKRCSSKFHKNHHFLFVDLVLTWLLIFEKSFMKIFQWLSSGFFVLWILYLFLIILNVFRSTINLTASFAYRNSFRASPLKSRVNLYTKARDDYMVSPRFVIMKSKERRHRFDIQNKNLTFLNCTLLMTYW